MSEKMRELLPCPFCGGLAQLSNDAADNPEAHDLFFIFCNTCGASTDTGHDDGDVISAWNRRAALAQQPVSVPEDHIAIRKDVVAFLNGSGSLEGHTYGEQKIGDYPYWWRRYLPDVDAVVKKDKR